MDERFARYMKEADAQFKELSAPDSQVRHMSEARRENGAEDYDGEAVMTAFAHMLKSSVQRFGDVAKAFATPYSSDEPK